MSDLKFTPVFRELTRIVNGKKYSTMYAGKHYGKNLLLLKHESLTLILVLTDDEQLFVPEFVKTVSSRDKHIKSGVKIVGNNNVILMLDEVGNLWQLINAFEFSNEKDECLHLLDNTCFYEWVPFKKFKKFSKVCEISALGDGFACVGVNENSEKRLQVLSSVEGNVMADDAFEELNITLSHNYYLTNIKLNIEDSAHQNEIEHEKEVLLVTDRTNGKSYICSKANKAFIVNISNIPLVSVIILEDKNCVLFCFENGKLVFLLYNNLVDCSDYLSKKLTAIEKCSCSDSCLIWSDGINLHHTNMEFQLDKLCFVKLKHLEVKYNISGVISLLKMKSSFLAVTVNNFYYQITINKFEKSNEIHKSPSHILQEIFEAGLKVSELNKVIETGREFLEGKEMVQSNDLSKEVNLKVEGKYIVLRSNIKKVFKKDFWKIKLSGTFQNKQLVEIIDLETDLSKDMTVNIETDLLKKCQVEVSLVGSFGNECNLLCAKLGKVENEKKDMEKNELVRDLYEMAKRRNPYFKAE